jgi:heme exporter protein D
MSTSQEQQQQQPGRRPTSPTRSFSPMWLAAAVLLLMFVASLFSSVLRQRETIQYSQFKQLLAERLKAHDLS